MKLVFVNHMHPATPHVSGMRSWFFARELVNRGHQVVQICEWREGAEPAPSPEQFAKQFQAHDWGEPLLLAVRPQRRVLLERIRSPRTPALLRKALVTWSYLKHSGMFTDFSQATEPYLGILSREFRPQAIWGLFGNTDCWLIAQRLSEMADCPWVADMKDSWEVFLRKPLRSIIAKRFRNMRGATANAELNAEVLRRWFTPAVDVIYSGVEPCFFSTHPTRSKHSEFLITLTGSIHSQEALSRFVQALMVWLEKRADDSQVGVALVYAGGANRLVEAEFLRLKGRAAVRIHPYLPLAELAEICRSAQANVYIRNDKGFHHKLFELLGCGKPVIAFGGESDEAKRLARLVDGTLLPCRDESSLSLILDELSGAPRTNQAPQNVAALFSWSACAEKLEEGLRRAAESEYFP
ncbi:glycosyltransferase [Methylolobus aquaticus]